MHADWHLPDPQSQPEFYADVPLKRLLAWLIDTLVVIVLSLVLLPLTAFTALFFFPFFYLLIGFAYRVITLANRSATPGMRVMAIEMRRADGTRFDLAMAFWHTFGYSVSIALMPLQLISIVLMLTTERAQGLSDHALGTVALNRRAGA